MGQIFGVRAKGIERAVLPRREIGAGDLDDGRSGRFDALAGLFLFDPAEQIAARNLEGMVAGGGRSRPDA